MWHLWEIRKQNQPAPKPQLLTRPFAGLLNVTDMYQPNPFQSGALRLIEDSLNFVNSNPAILHQLDRAEANELVRSTHIESRRGAGHTWLALMIPALVARKERVAILAVTLMRAKLIRDNLSSVSREDSDPTWARNLRSNILLGKSRGCEGRLSGISVLVVDGARHLSEEDKRRLYSEFTGKAIVFLQ